MPPTGYDRTSREDKDGRKIYSKGGKYYVRRKKTDGSFGMVLVKVNAVRHSGTSRKSKGGNNTTEKPLEAKELALSAARALVDAARTEKMKTRDLRLSLHFLLQSIGDQRDTSHDARLIDILYGNVNITDPIEAAQNRTIITGKVVRRNLLMDSLWVAGDGPNTIKQDALKSEVSKLASKIVLAKDKAYLKPVSAVRQSYNGNFERFRRDVSALVKLIESNADSLYLGDLQRVYRATVMDLAAWKWHS